MKERKLCSVSIICYILNIQDIMYKHYVIRNQLYPEEFYDPKILNQQICVNFDYEESVNESFELIKENNLYSIGERTSMKTTRRSSMIKVIFYVNNDKLALELANRWINEPKQKSQDYRVIGIDRYFSVFD